LIAVAFPEASCPRFFEIATIFHAFLQTSQLTRLAAASYDETSFNIESGAIFLRRDTSFRSGIFLMIKVEGLTKRYARTVAVNDVSFEVEKGQIVGFLGPNGAGKTTTMRILTGFLPATSGTANVAGFDVQENPMEVKKRIGYLPETPPVYPEMEVWEYLDFAGQLKGISKADIKRRTDDAIGRCSLGDVRSKLIGKLSKGYRQRVGIAQAIIHNPDVLILDEPTSGLDPKQIIEIRELLRALAGEHTIILSTHILSEVEHSCERVIIISQGRIVAQDSVSNLTNRLHGSESVSLEVEAGDGRPAAGEVQQRLEQVSGVSRVMMKEPRDGRLVFEVESLQGRHIRAELARSVVNAGWNLNELRAVGISLEDIFLQLTTAEIKGEQDGGKQ
jgi:ABC-2 type transport system ATP-binding protein